MINGAGPSDAADEVCKNRAFRSLLLALLTRRLLLARVRQHPGGMLPGRPCHKEIIWKVALLAGIGLRVPGHRRHRRRRSAAAVLGWQDRHRSVGAAWPAPEWVTRSTRGIGDTGKRHVAQVFAGRSAMTSRSIQPATSVRASSSPTPMRLMTVRCCNARLPWPIVTASTSSLSTIAPPARGARP